MPRRVSVKLAVWQATWASASWLVAEIETTQHLSTDVRAETASPTGDSILATR
jgi:hypothetical protein